MITFLDKMLHQLGGKWERSYYFKDRNFFAEAQFTENIPSNRIADSPCNDSYHSLLTIVLDEIERGHGIELFSNLSKLHVELFMKKESIPGRCAPSLGIALKISFSFKVANGMESDGLLGMGDPQYRTEDDGNLIFFGKFKRRGDHLMSF